jgi:hypothetical protein
MKKALRCLPTLYPAERDKLLKFSKLSKQETDELAIIFPEKKSTNFYDSTAIAQVEKTIEEALKHVLDNAKQFLVEQEMAHLQNAQDGLINKGQIDRLARLPCPGIDNLRKTMLSLHSNVNTHNQDYFVAGTFPKRVQCVLNGITSSKPALDPPEHRTEYIVDNERDIGVAKHMDLFVPRLRHITSLKARLPTRLKNVQLGGKSMQDLLALSRYWLFPATIDPTTRDFAVFYLESKNIDISLIAHPPATTIEDVRCIQLLEDYGHSEKMLKELTDAHQKIQDNRTILDRMKIDFDREINNLKSDSLAKRAEQDHDNAVLTNNIKAQLLQLESDRQRHEQEELRINQLEADCEKKKNRM